MFEAFDVIGKYHWLVIGVLLIILEIFIGSSFFLLWLGVSAISIALILWYLPEISWQLQLLIFSVELIGCLIYWQIYSKRKSNKGNKNYINKRAQQFVGRVFTLEQPIVNGRGKIKTNDSVWIVSGPDLPEGSKVEITGVDGVILIVKQC